MKKQRVWLALGAFGAAALACFAVAELVFDEPDTGTGITALWSAAVGSTPVDTPRLDGPVALDVPLAPAPFEATPFGPVEIIEPISVEPPLASGNEESEVIEPAAVPRPETRRMPYADEVVEEASNDLPRTFGWGRRVSVGRSGQEECDMPEQPSLRGQANLVVPGHYRLVEIPNNQRPMPPAE